MEVVGSKFRAGAWSHPWPSAGLDGDRTLVLAFGPSKPPPELQGVLDAVPGAVVTGCSTAGEVFGAEVDDDTLVVAIARFEHTRLRSATTVVSGGADSYEVGRRVARQLEAPDLRYVLLLAPGLGVNGAALARGVTERLGPAVTVTGGLAADGSRFERTWVLCAGKPSSNGVCAVGFYGSRLAVSHGTRGGWDPFGPERTITRSEENVLLQLDDRPALDLYEEYLGELASGLPANALRFPLSIRDPVGGRPPLVRTILGIDPARRSMTFAGDMPTGWRARLMRTSFDRLIAGASEAAELASPAGPALAIAVSCVGRRLMLGERAEEETGATLEAFPKGTVQVGFYSYGELSPVARGVCDLHNQTMTLTTLREE